MTDQDQASPKNRSLLTILLLAVGMAMAVVGVVLLIVDDERDTPLVILKADTSPYKVEPEHPGGLTINSQDSPVMSLLEKQQDDKTGTEVLLPPESEPELPPIAVDNATQTTAATAASPASPEPAAASAAPPEPSSSQPVAAPAEPAQPEATQPEDAPAEPVAAPAEPVAAPAATVSTETVSTEATQPESAQPAIAPAATVSTEPTQPESAKPENIDDAVESVLNTPPETLPKKRPRSQDGEPYFVVQFAAFKTEKSAKTTAALLSQKHAERLNGVELGHIKRGEYWRVVSDPMLRAEAARLCNTLRSVGQDCITKLLEDTP
ncbi:SPOR domain-containing protein [Alphaproteobacteria bacterium LSUCC0684]